MDGHNHHPLIILILDRRIKTVTDILKFIHPVNFGCDEHFTWSEVLRFVYKDAVVVSKSGSIQLVQLEITVVRHGHIRVLKVLHPFPEKQSIRNVTLWTQ